MSDLGLVVVALAIATGIVGVVVPVLPGSLLAWAAIAVWALAVGSATAWAVLAVATLVDRRRPARQAARARAAPARRGRPPPVHLAGVVLAVAGFFLIPVVGFFLGFPLGVYLEERRRLGRHVSAWSSTREALRAMGLSIVIELSATWLAAGAWLAAVLSLSSRACSASRPSCRCGRRGTW